MISEFSAGLSGLIMGGINGFYNGQGRIIEPEGLETTLKYGPVAIGGVLGGIGGLFLGALSDSRDGGPISEGIFRGIRGAAVGGFFTVVSYCAGYTLGGVLK
ncbi:hypothetical protein HZA97_04455 [Candidatus Woesearchaeota archaeon]|nr:hypothetical protein [Candidatus Woesearchaeota archaeon]